MSLSTVYMWVAKCKSGLQQLKDAAHPGHHATTMTKRNIQKIHTLLKKDTRFTMRPGSQTC